MTIARRERRRAAVDQRDQRRDTIRNLLARVDRAAAGRLTITPAEAAQLRAQVEAEIAHTEDMRRTAAGAQALARGLRQQLAAAEEAIVEAEADRDAARSRNEAHCTCAAAGDAFAPAGHYADCPSGRRAGEAIPVTLATPCASPECEHPRNWHTSTHGCVSRGGACPCRRFEPPTVRQAAAEQAPAAEEATQ